MPIPRHIIESPDKLAPALGDRVVIGVKASAANAAGGGAGQAVTIVVTGLQLPLPYVVLVQDTQDAIAFVTNKTATGFTINLEPRLAANTIAAGTVDYVVIA